MFGVPVLSGAAARRNRDWGPLRASLRPLAARATSLRPLAARATLLLLALFLRPGVLRASDAIPHVVTDEIQAGIRAHIEAETRRGGGYMVLRHGERELRLKLVRVHTEYLADLGGGSYFACVDLADVSGDVYDVDFFLSGKPGAMRVTEATVHKLNGQPYYTWRQRADGTWEHIPVEAASPRELGVVTGEDHFEFLYRATIPELTAKARMWLPYPVSDAFQTVELLSIETPRPYRLLDDRRNGNKVLFLELLPEDSGKRVELRFRVQRREKKA